MDDSKSSSSSESTGTEEEGYSLSSSSTTYMLDCWSPPTIRHAQAPVPETGSSDDCVAAIKQDQTGQQETMDDSKSLSSSQSTDTEEDLARLVKKNGGGTVGWKTEKKINTTKAPPTVITAPGNGKQAAAGMQPPTIPVTGSTDDCVASVSFRLGKRG